MILYRFYKNNVIRQDLGQIKEDNQKDNLTNKNQEKDNPINVQEDNLKMILINQDQSVQEENLK